MLTPDYNLFKDLLENSKSTYFLFETKTKKLIYVSDNFSKYWDLPVEKLIESPVLFYERIHFEDRKRIEEKVRACFKNPTKTFYEEFRVVTPYKSTCWMNAQSYPIFDNNGLAIRYVIVATENTLEKYAERQLKEALSTAKIGAWVLDFKTNHYTWSNEIYILLNKPFSFVPLYGDLWKIYPPEEVSRHGQLIKKSRSAKSPYSIEFSIFDKVGNRVWLKEEAIPIVENDKTVGFRGTLQDITQIKLSQEKLIQSERLYRLMSDNSSDLICLHAPEGHFVYVSPSSRDMLGYSPGELLNNHPKKYFHSYDASVFEEYLEFSNLDTIETNVIQYRFRCKDGKYLWVETATKPIFDEAGEVINLQTTTRNINERKTQEEDLRKAKDVAEFATRAKTEFLSTMSHEIRTPLNAVIGMTYLLLQDTPRIDQIEKLTTLKFASDNLLVLVNDILDFSKIEAGQIQLEMIDFSLYDLINNTKQALHYKAQEKGLGFRVKYDTDIPGILIGDSIRLSQILINLVSNAIKFTHDGSIFIEVNMIKNNDKNVLIHFEVVDTGIGMSKETQLLIFERFMQGSSDTTRKYGGTGLGLAITKQLIEIQGGKIEVESELKKGSKFSFELEFNKSEKTTLPFDSFQHRIENADLKGAYILVVEDNEVNQYVARMFLSRWNTRVDFAENGEIAIEKALQNNYDLILMDMQMPVMDGYEATRILKQMPDEKIANTPIIALTASAIVEIKDRIFKYGLDDYISKPFTPAELYMKIAKHLKIDSSFVPNSSPIPLSYSPSATTNFISLKGLDEITGGNPEFTQKLYEATIASFQQFLELFITAVKNFDIKGVRDANHGIKPAATMLEFKLLEKEILRAKAYLENKEKDEKVEIDIVNNVNSLVEMLETFLLQKLNDFV